MNKRPAFFVSCSSGEEINCPDIVDKYNGTVKYYGDNRTSGSRLTNTKKNGNKILEKVWNSNESSHFHKLPIFFF